ncbi:hypothetical protein PJI17_20420 [Mycobacterium kansasii]
MSILVDTAPRDGGFTVRSAAVNSPASAPDEWPSARCALVETNRARFGVASGAVGERP